LWEENLDPNKPPEEKVIKTLIYGVKSSGNQSERALRETANIFKEEHPKVHQIINNDVYVDDIELVVNHGGFTLKGFTFSYQKPHESLSRDGESVSVSGMNGFRSPTTSASIIQRSTLPRSIEERSQNKFKRFQKT